MFIIMMHTTLQHKSNVISVHIGLQETIPDLSYDILDGTRTMGDEH
jgi:hypothetical protein